VASLRSSRSARVKAVDAESMSTELLESSLSSDFASIFAGRVSVVELTALTSLLGLKPKSWES